MSGAGGGLTTTLNAGSLKLDKTDFLVLDETDRMLDMGFGIQLNEIASHLPKKRQTLMFSATLPDNIVTLSRKYLTQPVRIAVGSLNTPIDKIKQELIKTNDALKYGELLSQLKNYEGSVLVFDQNQIRRRTFGRQAEQSRF